MSKAEKKVKPAGIWVSKLQEEPQSTPQAGFEIKLQAKVDEIKVKAATRSSPRRPRTPKKELPPWSGRVDQDKVRALIQTASGTPITTLKQDSFLTEWEDPFDGTIHVSTKQEEKNWEEPRERVRQHCVEVFSSSPLYQARAAKDPTYWDNFSTGRINP